MLMYLTNRLSLPETPDWLAVLFLEVNVLINMVPSANQEMDEDWDFFSVELWHGVSSSVLSCCSVLLIGFQKDIDNLGYLPKDFEVPFQAHWLDAPVPGRTLRRTAKIFPLPDDEELSSDDDNEDDVKLPPK